MANRNKQLSVAGVGRESRRIAYRLRRRHFSDAAVFPGERDVGVDPAVSKALTEREKQVEKLQADNASLRDLALRARAELENAKKRLEREKAETVKYANERLVGELIHVLDNLERALDSVEETEETKPMRDGIRMVLDQFLGVLTANGLDVIAPDGQRFDPHFHEAVAAEEREDVEDNVILDTFQKGYVLRGRVVRPAMVRVARAVRPPEPAEEEAEPAEEVEAEAVAAADSEREDTLPDVEEEVPAEGGEEQVEDEVAEVVAGDPDAETPAEEEPGAADEQPPDPDATEDSEVTPEPPEADDEQKI